MQRLHQSLKISGVDSQIHCRKGQSPLADSQPLEFVQTRSGQWLERVTRRLENELLKQPGNVFAPLRATIKTPFPPTLPAADIYHLHWISRWLDLPSFLKSLPPTAPIVLTLHDLGNLTGGCHLYSGCHGFETTCQPCPLLKFPFNQFLANQELQRKKHWFGTRSVHVVGNSSWTTKMAAQSSVFEKAASIRTIHPGVDLQKFAYMSKTAAKQLLGILPNKIVVGFGCAELTDGNKNVGLFLQVCNRLAQEIDLEVIVFGNGFESIRQNPQFSQALTVPIHNLGKLNSGESLSLAYSAMNVFIMTSQIETFGQVALEAQACETPVCAFGVGGLTDAVEDGVTGFLSDFSDISEMTAQVLALAHNPEQRQRFGRRGRERVQASFSVEAVVDTYLTLYQEALALPSVTAS